MVTSVRVNRPNLQRFTPHTTLGCITYSPTRQTQTSCARSCLVLSSQLSSEPNMGWPPLPRAASTMVMGSTQGVRQPTISLLHPAVVCSRRQPLPPADFDWLALEPSEGCMWWWRWLTATSGLLMGERLACMCGLGPGGGTPID